MEVILIQDIDNLGGMNEVVKVRTDMPATFLFRKLAVSQSRNMKRLEEKMKRRRKRRSYVCGSKQCCRKIERNTAED
jgi:large subunit ribosomal protein L9